MCTSVDSVTLPRPFFRSNNYYLQLTRKTLALCGVADPCIMAYREAKGLPRSVEWLCSILHHLVDFENLNNYVEV